jgi:hypothetical protein
MTNERRQKNAKRNSTRTILNPQTTLSPQTMLSPLISKLNRAERKTRVEEAKITRYI